MNIVTIPSDLLQSNMYLVVEGSHALIIDPWVTELPESFRNVTIDRIYVTHEHIDHISGVNYWKEKSGAPFICSKKCASGCENSKKNLSSYIEVFWELQTWVENAKIPQIGEYEAKADKVFEGNYKDNWNGHMIEIIECPGHSSGSSVILIDSEYLFSGDCLFRDYPTATNIPGGSRKDWFDNSEVILRSMGDNVNVYPGHFQSFQLNSYRFWSK